MRFLKKQYKAPMIEVVSLMYKVVLLENSGEAETGMSKETTFTWNDDVNDLWGDESEEEQ